MTHHTSFIPANTHLPEITVRGVVLAVLLSLLLAVSNAYLALKIGLLTSASIPAAVISMGILRFFKNSNILENNLVQTAASAGEAVAGGIVYTIPAMIIIHYWTGFNYWENFFIALIGGVLGVMFSIPLRQVLMINRQLRFPEGKAIAEVLKISNTQSLGIKDVVYGGIVGALLEFCQSGIKILADSGQYWIKVQQTLFGFGIGFSPAMVGAGYLIGFRIAASIFVGATISWLVMVPVLSHVYPSYVSNTGIASDLAHQLWGDKIRYIGIGAMLLAGLMTFSSLFKSLLSSIKLSLQAIRLHRHQRQQLIRTEIDIPLPYVFFISVIFIIGLFFLYQYAFPMTQLGLSSTWMHGITFAVLLYTVIAGFVFCAITAYFSGMVGVSASPGSSIIIASLLIIAGLIFLLLHLSGYASFTSEQIKACEAITIICTAMITGMAAISNDNMQDLKVGHLLGSTPWKQQVMLLLGVVCASAIITPVMQMLYNVYGIAGVMPHAGMDASLSLPAPPAAVMATLSEAVFNQVIPWKMLLLGGAITIIICIINPLLDKRNLSLSILGVAIGIYLPLTSSMPLFIGGLIAWLINGNKEGAHRDMMLACGLIAGAALLDVALAVPFSIMHDPNALRLTTVGWEPIGFLLSVIVCVRLFRWFKRLA